MRGRKYLTKEMIYIIIATDTVLNPNIQQASGISLAAYYEAGVGS
jgi:hypothetical protein